MITPSSIDKVKAAYDIVDVIIDAGVNLKKKGTNYQGCCPFHQEKSPSFSVNPVEGFYKCFGCNESGDAITFLEKHKGFTFYEAIEYLANKYNIQLEYTNETISQEEKDEKSRAYEMMREVKKTFKECLHQNQDAIEYLTKVRGLTSETIALWEIGYAPDSWRTISDKMIKANSWDLAVKCGICVEKPDGKNHDFFKNRIMFPIHDEKGNCISFGGRIWTKKQDDAKESKYMNGKETFIYDKSKVIFGMHRAMLDINKAQEGILVEGYLDVIMAHQNEIKNAVATCGTGVTETHISMLLKRAKSWVLAGDSDSAGIKSISKSIDMFLEAGAVSLSVLVWPEGIKDIDQFLTTNE